MERLHYIDEHARSVDANRDRAWKAVLKVIGKNPSDPSSMEGGFAVESAEEPRRLALRGEHWFSKYQLIFELDEEGPSRTRVRARSFAEFPGLSGKVYRALVIGTGGHRMTVRWMLRRIAAAA
ncbi:hypothetical protein OHA40_02335 [Nocardia sp. NBC_00508]|uniref:hypothetical protein n=1 Tax=Nocardia sp. NBC_00508 TaxID=2975992 RepID=UPI002E8026EC|nr:hypothetical protein [Nocardia sp. NBC_00508]WUD67018.1 hypothetical protein OHA40_02335 [Nocardia sp. NBC_00508]